MTSDRSDRSGSRVTGLVFTPWNLLLLLPFIVLFTPLYNQTEPRLVGLPFFYWFQLALILLGVLSTTVVYRRTHSARTVPPPDDGPDVDQLEEGSLR